MLFIVETLGRDFHRHTKFFPETLKDLLKDVYRFLETKPEKDLTNYLFKDSTIATLRIVY